MRNPSAQPARFPRAAETMSAVTIQLPDGVVRQLRECAEKQSVTVEQLLSAAAAENLSALLTLEHLRERARRAKREDFVQFLNESPESPPLPGDQW